MKDDKIVLVVAIVAIVQGFSLRGPVVTDNQFNLSKVHRGIVRACL